MVAPRVRLLVVLLVALMVESMADKKDILMVEMSDEIAAVMMVAQRAVMLVQFLVVKMVY